MAQLLDVRDVEIPFEIVGEEDAKKLDTWWRSDVWLQSGRNRVSRAVDVLSLSFLLVEC